MIRLALLLFLSLSALVCSVAHGAVANSIDHAVGGQGYGLEALEVLGDADHDRPADAAGDMDVAHCSVAIPAVACSTREFHETVRSIPIPVNVKFLLGRERGPAERPPRRAV